MARIADESTIDTSRPLSYGWTAHASAAVNPRGGARVEVAAVKRGSLVYGVGGIVLGAVLGWGVFDTVSHVRRAEIGPQPAAPAASGPTGSRTYGDAAPTMQPSTRDEVDRLKGALGADPRNANVLTRLGNLYQDAGRCAEGVPYYERAIGVNPRDANLLTDTGVCYRQLKQFEKALEMFGRAREADPSHWQSLYNTAVVAGFDLGRFDVARRALDQLVEINPSAPSVQQLRQELERLEAERSGGKRS